MDPKDTSKTGTQEFSIDELRDWISGGIEFLGERWVCENVHPSGQQIDIIVDDLGVPPKNAGSKQEYCFVSEIVLQASELLKTFDETHYRSYVHNHNRENGLIVFDIKSGETVLVKFENKGTVQSIDHFSIAMFKHITDFQYGNLKKGDSGLYFEKLLHLKSAKGRLEIIRNPETY